MILLNVIFSGITQEATEGLSILSSGLNRSCSGATIPAVLSWGGRVDFCVELILTYFY